MVKMVKLSERVKYLPIW